MNRMQKFLLRYRYMAGLLGLVWPAMWAFDREPPFRVVKYIEPEAVRAGGNVVFAFPVYRNVDRECDVRFARHLIDAGGLRHEYTGPQMLSGTSLRKVSEKVC